ncbi:MAG TPA: hypothetical protein VGF49_24425 [Candidatus Solibacter sp.]|jgi:hypothetical protein
MDNQCILQLCDPDALSAGDAIRLARRVSRVEPNLAPSLGAFVGHLSHAPDADPRAMRRALELLYAVSDPRSFAKTCERVVRSESPVSSSLLRWLAAETPRRMESTALDE